MDKTKLDLKNPHHQILVSTLSLFIDEYGYTPRELIELLDDTKRQTFHAFVEMHKEVSP